MSVASGEEKMIHAPLTPTKTTSQSEATASQFEFGFHDTFDPIFNDIDPAVLNRFIDYDKKNPEIYKWFKWYAYRLFEQGKKHIRSKRIFEDLRDEPALSSEGRFFKADNRYTGCYARKLILEDPKFKDLFELRKTPGVINEQEY